MTMNKQYLNTIYGKPDTFAVNYELLARDIQLMKDVTGDTIPEVAKAIGVSPRKLSSMLNGIPFQVTIPMLMYVSVNINYPVDFMSYVEFVEVPHEDSYED